MSEVARWLGAIARTQNLAAVVWFAGRRAVLACPPDLGLWEMALEGAFGLLHITRISGGLRVQALATAAFIPWDVDVSAPRSRFQMLRAITTPTTRNGIINGMATGPAGAKAANSKVTGSKIATHRGTVWLRHRATAMRTRATMLPMK
jgi:hypothetical protein